jgi:hypothetical protein
MLRVCRSNTFPLGPARVPRRKTVMIESTASGGAGVTGSPSGELSTWQLGVKHSITKRRTRGPCREVRLVPVAGPHRVRASPQTLPVQVERAVRGSSEGVGAWPGSWPKTCGRVRGNRSVDRRIPAGPATAPVRPLGQPGVPRLPGARVGGRAPPWSRPGLLTSAGFGGRVGGTGPPRLQGLEGRPRGVPFGAAQQGAADGGDGRKTQGGAGGTGQRGAVPDEDDGHEDATERGPADEIADGVLGGGGGGGGSGRRGRCGGVGVGAGAGARVAAVGRTGYGQQGLPGVMAQGVQRGVVPPVTAMIGLRVRRGASGARGQGRPAGVSGARGARTAERRPAGVRKAPRCPGRRGEVRVKPPW